MCQPRSRRILDAAVEDEDVDKLAIIAEFLETRLGVARDSVTPDATLESLGVDSLLLLELLFEVEDKLGIKTPAEDLKTPSTIGDLITLVVGLGQSA